MGDPGATSIRPSIAKAQGSEEKDQKHMLFQSHQSIKVFSHSLFLPYEYLELQGELGHKFD